MGKPINREMSLPVDARAPSFRFWLKQHRDALDAIGEFARYMLSCTDDLPANCLEAYREKLDWCGPPDAMLQALDVAWEKYRVAALKGLRKR